jgi:hypothetical protein
MYEKDYIVGVEDWWRGGGGVPKCLLQESQELISDT